jgi:hypothetical protein
MATAVGTPPAGFAALSRAVVSAAADLVMTVERAVVGEQKLRTARGNAWDALCADRARAQARDEMDALVRALLANGPRAEVTMPKPTRSAAPEAPATRSRGASRPRNTTQQRPAAQARPATARRRSLETTTNSRR